MNTQTARLAYKTGKAAYNTFMDFRDRKAAQAYEATSDMLNDAAKTYQSLRTSTRELAADMSEETKTAQKKLSRVARRKAAKLEKRMGGNKRRRCGAVRKIGKFTFVSAFFAAVAGVIYFWWSTRPDEQPSTTPPRVEEHSGSDVAADADSGTSTESRLVYSTQTPVDDAEDEASGKDSDDTDGK